MKKEKDRNAIEKARSIACNCAQHGCKIIPQLSLMMYY